MRDEQKLSRGVYFEVLYLAFVVCLTSYFVLINLSIIHVMSTGCAFVKYPSRDMAMAAVNALSGIFTMKVNIPTFN